MCAEGVTLNTVISGVGEQCSSFGVVCCVHFCTNCFCELQSELVCLTPKSLDWCKQARLQALGQGFVTLDILSAFSMKHLYTSQTKLLTMKE